MTKKRKNRKEYARQKRHVMQERNREEVKRATKAREDFIAKQAVDHFQHLKESDPEFAKLVESMQQPVDEDATIIVDPIAETHSPLKAKSPAGILLEISETQSRIDSVLREQFEKIAKSFGCTVEELSEHVPEMDEQTAVYWEYVTNRRSPMSMAIEMPKIAIGKYLDEKLKHQS